ncbi:MAG: flagellar basal body P-ring formation protein FlgA [Rhodocyclales bacterium]|nr:flagellar basal body P-ring formation protein FlgA [Rhodocyclales bacterium]
MHPTPKSLVIHLATALAALLAAPSLHAQQPPEPVTETARQLLDRESAGLPGQVVVTVEAMQGANHLPECAQLEPFLPAGTRAWGQINVGVRCLAPVAWTVFLPARVAVMNDYLITARPIRAGQIVAPGDLAPEHGDLTTLPANILTDPTQAIGHHSRYAIAAGKPLRATMLRIPPAVQQGQTVKVVSVGTGFSVTNEGRALNRAGAGESVKVRLKNGQVVTGTAQPGGIVEVRY